MTPPTNVVLVDTSAWICFFARKKFPQIKKWLTALLEKDQKSKGTRANGISMLDSILFARKSQKTNLKFQINFKNQI